jgi:hypothetical protein
MARQRRPALSEKLARNHQLQGSSLLTAESRGASRKLAQPRSSSGTLAETRSGTNLLAARLRDAMLRAA